MQNNVFGNITTVLKEQKDRTVKDIAISLIFTALTVITGLLLADLPKSLRVATVFYCGISILLITRCTARFIRHMIEISSILKSGLEMTGKSGRLEGEEAEKLIQDIGRISKKMHGTIIEYTRIWTSFGLIAIISIGCYFLLKNF